MAAFFSALSSQSLIKLLAAYWWTIGKDDRGPSSPPTSNSIRCSISLPNTLPLSVTEQCPLKLVPPPFNIPYKTNLSPLNIGGILLGAWRTLTPAGTENVNSTSVTEG